MAAGDRIYKPGWQFSVAVTAPAAPSKGDPVVVGMLTGVALTDLGGGGNPPTMVTVDFGPAVWEQTVTDAVGTGIAVGDPLFADAVLAALSNDSTGLFWGYALETLGAGGNGVIKVMHVPSPAAGVMGAGTVATLNLANGAVTAAKLDDDILTGLHAAEVADANTDGGLPILFRIDVAGGAAGNTDLVVDEKVRVIDAWAVHTGGAGQADDTIQIFNGAAAITDAMDWSGADNALVRAAEIDDAAHEVAAGGTLRVTTTDNDSGGDVGAGTVYVLAVKVA